MTVELTLPASRYPDWRQVNLFYAELLDRLRRGSEIVAAAVAYDHPLQSTWINSFSIEGHPASRPGEEPVARLVSVSADYLRTAGIALLRGRSFSGDDSAGRPGVALINRSLAQRYFAGEDPIGRRIKISVPVWGGALPSTFEVVGIVGDVRSLGPSAPPEPTFFLPAPQFPIHDMVLLVRSARPDPLALLPEVRSAVRALDRDLPLGEVSTMDLHRSNALARPRFGLSLVSSFSALALTLAAVGIHGLLSFSVAQRTREIGLRIALGAGRAQVAWMVVSQALRWTVLGLAIGLFLSLGLGRVAGSLLFGVGPRDPASLGAVSAILLAVAVVAGTLPARRASRVDPLDSFRAE